MLNPSAILHKAWQYDCCFYAMTLTSLSNFHGTDVEFECNGSIIQWKLEQLERLHSEDTPAASWLPTLLSHVESQVKTRLNDLEDIGQGQRSSHATPSYASDHLYQIWKESIQNCRRYRADMVWYQMANKGMPCTYIRGLTVMSRIWYIKAYNMVMAQVEH